MFASIYRKNMSARKAICLVAGLLAFAAPGVIAADATDAITATTVSRYFLTQADARCHALPADAATALKAGYLQARNTALRAGHSMSDLAPWLDRARDAAANVPCDNAKLDGDFTDAAQAYRRFITQIRLDLPGVRAGWQADRAYGDDARWRLVQYQNLADADLAFGIYGKLGAPRFTVMANFHDGEKPYAARLLLRNPQTLSYGLIDTASLSVSPTRPFGFDGDALGFMARASNDVSAVLHPALQVQTASLAFGSSTGPAEQDATRFDFPSRAWPAIARLDPREDMVVEFDFDSGPRYVRFEVGDFITGLMFVTLPQPYTHNQLNTAG